MHSRKNYDNKVVNQRLNQPKNQPTKERKLEHMLEEEIHNLIANDVTCNLLEVDGSISPNEDPNNLKTAAESLTTCMIGLAFYQR